MKPGLKSLTLSIAVLILVVLNSSCGSPAASSKLPPPPELLSQTITFPAVTPGITFTLNATASSGLPVGYSTTDTACSISGNTVTELSAGDCLIEANQAGNTVYAAAPEVSQDISIGEKVALVSVTPSSVTLAPGASQLFTASAFDQFNKSMTTVPTFTWTGANQTGSFTAVNTTDANVTDTVTASAGGIVSAPAQVTVTAAPAVLTVVTLAPQNPTINAPNGTANFSITAADQFGRPYVPAPSCTYLSSNPAAATIGTNGQANAVNAGTTILTTTITASCGSFSPSTTLTVDPPPFIKTLTATPNPASVTVYGSPVTVVLAAADEYGNPIAIAAGQITVVSFDSTYVTAAVGAPNTNSINVGGVLATPPSNFAPVVVQVGTVSVTVNVTVNACPPVTCYAPVLTSISVTPATTSMEFSGTQIASASALDQHGAAFQTAFAWTSNTSSLTVDASGNVTAVSLGTGTVSASANSVTGTSPTITVVAAPYPSTPVITSLFPPMAVAKTYAGSTQGGLQPHSTAVVVNGTGFQSGAAVCFGSDCSPAYTTFKSSTQLVMLVPWQDLTTVGPVNVTVQNPTITGYTNPTTSVPLIFTLTNKGFVTITFDDGFTSAFTNGTPLFNAQGIATTQFIITGNSCVAEGICPGGLRADGYPWGWNGVGANTGCVYSAYPLPVTAAQISGCAVGVGQPNYITWANVAALAAAGNEIAPHTRSHDELSLELPADVTGELQGALQDLQFHAAPGADTAAGYPVSQVFAYPYGDYGCYSIDPAFNTCVTGQFTDQQIGTQVKGAGYHGARSSDAALEGGLKYNEMLETPSPCALDSCWGWTDQPLFMHTLAADQALYDTCTFAGGTACDSSETGQTNGAATCVDTQNPVPTYTNAMGVTTPAPGFRCWVDQAVETGQWVILLFHRVDDNTAADISLSVNSTELQALALYLKNNNITTVTYSQGLAMEGIDGQTEPVDTGGILSYPSPVD